MPDEVPNTNEEVPEGLIVVDLADALIPICLAIIAFVSFTKSAARFKSNF